MDISNNREYIKKMDISNNRKNFWEEYGFMTFGFSLVVGFIVFVILAFLGVFK